MKYVLLWFQGWLEWIIEGIVWLIHEPYFRAIYSNEIRKQIKNNYVGHAPGSREELVRQAAQSSARAYLSRVESVVDARQES
jgi:hypothetical protein